MGFARILLANMRAKLYNSLKQQQLRDLNICRSSGCGYYQEEKL